MSGVTDRDRCINWVYIEGKQRFRCMWQWIQVMTLVSESDAKGLPQELSGPADPIRVSVAHVLDLEEGTLSLRIGVGNRLSAELRNIVVR